MIGHNRMRFGWLGSPIAIAASAVASSVSLLFAIDRWVGVSGYLDNASSMPDSWEGVVGGEIVATATLSFVVLWISRSVAERSAKLRQRVRIVFGDVRGYRQAPASAWETTNGVLLDQIRAVGFARGTAAGVATALVLIPIGLSRSFVGFHSVRPHPLEIEVYVAAASLIASGHLGFALVEARRRSVRLRGRQRAPSRRGDA